MKLKGTDKDWEYFGQTNPYFSVLTWDDFKKENLSIENRERFFASGQNYITTVLQVICDDIAPGFDVSSARALDFGCGVGRLVIPLARVCKSVTGVDVSDTMLAETQKNCQAYDISNVDLINNLDAAEGMYDLVHSFIVFQHIPPKRGEAILKSLLRRLREGGIGILHLTYYRRETRLRRFLYQIRTAIPFLSGFLNLLKGRPFGQPIMQMNEYNLNHVLQMLQEADCHQCQLRFTQHGETSGVILFFQKKALSMM